MPGAVALAAMLLAGAAWAKPTPGAAPPQPKLFISPSGEPFRLAPGDPDPLKAWFDEADTDHDGSIDQAEFRADALRFFKKLDENGDGVLDGFETQDYENKVVPELGEWVDGRFPGEFGPPRQGHGAEGGEAQKHGLFGGGGHAKAPPKRSSLIAQLIDEPEPVTGADYQLDGDITQDEWMKATDQRFALLDAAHAGRLTLEELRARLNPPRKKAR